MPVPAAAGDEPPGQLQLLHALALCHEANAFAVSGAAALVHLRIDPGGVAAQLALDEVRALEETSEVKAGKEPYGAYAGREQGNVDAAL